MNDKNEINVPLSKKKIDKKSEVEVSIDKEQYDPENLRKVPDHTHDGVNSTKIKQGNLIERRRVIQYTIPGTQAATATNYGVFFLALYPCFVRVIKEEHQAAGTDGLSVGLNIEKLTGATAPDSGDVILSTNIDLKGTINTSQKGALKIDRKVRTLGVGDKLCMKDVGTLTSVGNVHVIIEIEYLN